MSMVGGIYGQYPHHRNGKQVLDFTLHIVQLHSARGEPFGGAPETVVTMERRQGDERVKTSSKSTVEEKISFSESGEREYTHYSRSYSDRETSEYSTPSRSHIVCSPLHRTRFRYTLSPLNGILPGVARRR